MATTVAAAGGTSDRPPLCIDSIPVVDLSLFSQAELYALSLSSNFSFDLNRCDDVVIPKINRSVFNESTGSRRQTYSRLRLASAESTKTTTLHRRTPHLRLSHTPASSSINDPEQAENSQIIRMLKQLCKSDPNFEDVVQIEDENFVVPEFLNPDTLEIKRKRGRPRKHENVVFLRPPTAKRIRNNTVKKVVVYDYEMDREIVNDKGVTVNVATLAGLEDPYGPEIKRRTVGMSTEDELLGFLRGLNGQWGSRRKKRRVVDASEFGDALPKGWRLSLCIKKKEGRVWLFCRRYLSPSGQQFESCKEISTYLISVIGEENLNKPNHGNINCSDDFASKETSVNAADLILQEDTKRDGPVNNPSSSSSCPNKHPSPSSPPEPPLPTNHEEQVTMDIDDAMEEVQVGDLFKCLKCSMIFEGKDHLLDHQVLAHDAEKSQLVTAVPEWVIVEDGIFECQICRTSFDERNQYNDHIGCHVKIEIEKTEPPLTPATELDCDPVLMTGVHNKEPLALFSAGDSDVVQTYDAHSGDKLERTSCVDSETNPGKPSNTDELVHDLNDVSNSKQDGQINVDRNIFVEESCDKSGNNNTINDEVCRTDQIPNVAVSQSELLGDEVPMSIDESKRKPEISGETNVVHKLDCNLDQALNHGSFLLSPFPNEEMGKPSSVGKEEISVSATGQVLNQDAVSEAGVTYVESAHDKSEAILEQGSSRSCLLPSSPNEQMGSGSGLHVGKDIVGKVATAGVLNPPISETVPFKSSICEEKGFSANMDMHNNNMSDELISGKEKVVGESSFGLFLDRFGLDKDGATVVKKLSTKPTRSLVSPSIDSVKIVNSESLICTQKQEPVQKGCFGSSSDDLAHGTYENVNELSSGLASSRLDRQFDVRRNAFGSYGVSGIEGVSAFGEENQFRSHPSLTSWQEEECENKNVGSEVSFHTMDEPRMQMNSESRLLLSGGEQSCTKVPSNKSKEAKLDDLQIFSNNEAKRNESIASLGSSHDGLNRDVLDFNTKNSLEFCSLVPSENEQAFSFQDDVTCLYDRAMEECKQESSERGLLNHFSIADTSDDIFENKIYSTPLDGLKFDEDRDISSNELSLAFGNPHALYPNTIRVEQKKDLVSCSVPSKVEEAFDVHTSLSMVNNSMVDDLKAGRGSVGGLFNLSCNNKTSSFQNGANTVYPGRTWEGLKSDRFKNSGNKFTTGFGSSHGQTHEVVPSGMWKTGDRNQLQSGLSNPSHSQIQSPSSFHSFNIMSEKAEDSQFRVDERYNSGFGVSGLRSGRPEPVEFSFLTAGRSQHPLQGDSRVFSYNAGIEQQFDSSSFWLGKNAMMASRNQITSVCAWCRNEFHLQPPHSGTQDGIGSLCPSCSAGMSGHVNML